MELYDAVKAVKKSNRGLTPIRLWEWVRVPARQVAKAVAALDAAASTLSPAARAGSGTGVIQDGGKNGVYAVPVVVVRSPNSTF